eukprot:11162167-Lingulodinium_polyedra.AAC.1
MLQFGGGGAEPLASAPVVAPSLQAIAPRPPVEGPAPWYRTPRSSVPALPTGGEAPVRTQRVGA